MLGGSKDTDRERDSTSRRPGASATSRGQFAKQFRLENERVRSISHYVTRTNERTASAERREERGGGRLEEQPQIIRERLG